MTVTAIEVVGVNLVLADLRLISSQEGLKSFKASVGTDVQQSGVGMALNVTTGAAEPGVIYTLSRDRISLDLSAARSVVTREFPTRDDLPMLATIAGKAIDVTHEVDDELVAFGVNIDLIFGQDSKAPAYSYLSRRLFNSDVLENERRQLFGGSGKLLFDDKVGRRWTFSLEPRFNDATEVRVFLSVNLHSPPALVPARLDIESSLLELWDETHQFVDQLDAIAP